MQYAMSLQINLSGRVIITCRPITHVKVPSQNYRRPSEAYEITKNNRCLPAVTINSHCHPCVLGDVLGLLNLPQVRQ